MYLSGVIAPLLLFIGKGVVRAYLATKKKRGGVLNLNAIAGVLVGVAVALPIIGKNKPQVDMTQVLCRTGIRLLTPEEQNSMQMKLVQAGVDTTPEYLYGMKAILASGTILISFLFMMMFSTNWLSLALIAPILYFIPDLWLNKKRAARQGMIKMSLSDFAKWLAVALTAGTNLLTALSEAAKAIASKPGGIPLRDEVELTIKDHNAGKPLVESLYDMAIRTDVEELNSLVSTINQAYLQGAPLAETVSAYSSQMRMVRKFEAMEQAGKLSIKLIPIVLVFILVPILIVIGYPAVYSLMQAF